MEYDANLHYMDNAKSRKVQHTCMLVFMTIFYGHDMKVMSVLNSSCLYKQDEYDQHVCIY